MSDPRITTHKFHFTSRRDLRPIVTSLNGDNSWLLSFPRPESERKSSGKAYFHLVHDPWLNGPETAISSWVVQLTLTSTPVITNGAGVEDLVHEIESSAAEAGFIHRPEQGKVKGRSQIDGILLNFHYGDHMHKPTLLTFDSSIPVFTTTDAAPLLKRFNHFTSITTYPDLDATFTGALNGVNRAQGLPSYLKVFRIKGHHELNFISIILWKSTPGTQEAILYSPHGLHTSTPVLQTLLHHAGPPFTTLALLHGLKESWTWGWQTAFGARNGLELYRQSRPRHWVATHNGALKYGGIVWWLVNDIFRTVEWALGQEKEGQEAGKDVKVEEVRSGECFVLD